MVFLWWFTHIWPIMSSWFFNTYHRLQIICLCVNAANCWLSCSYSSRRKQGCRQHCTLLHIDLDPSSIPLCFIWSDTDIVTSPPLFLFLCSFVETSLWYILDHGCLKPLHTSLFFPPFPPLGANELVVLTVLVYLASLMKCKWAVMSTTTATWGKSCHS